MRRYSEPVQVRSSAQPDAVRGTDEVTDEATDEVTGGVIEAGAEAGAERGAELDGAPVGVRSPEAFIWQGRLYVVRGILAHWRERRSWWRDALDPVPGQPTGLAAASREQHVWRVEASRGLAYGTGVFDLTSDGAEGDAGWRLVGVAD
jgi:hypothetical protein